MRVTIFLPVSFGFLGILKPKIGARDMAHLFIISPDPSPFLVFSLSRSPIVCSMCTDMTVARVTKLDHHTLSFVTAAFLGWQSSLIDQTSSTTHVQVSSSSHASSSLVSHLCFPAMGFDFGGAGRMSLISPPPPPHSTGSVESGFRIISHPGWI